MKTIPRGTTPSEKARITAEAAVDREKEKERAESELRGTIARLAQTEDGQFFLRWLCKECGWGQPYTAMNSVTATIDPTLTVYQAIRLNLWWKVRKYLPIRQRIEVEDV